MNFNKDIAKYIGVNEAVVYEQLKLLSKNQVVKISIEQLQSTIDIFNTYILKEILNSLQANGYIKQSSQRDRMIIKLLK